jgi:hypothetical protein
VLLGAIKPAGHNDGVASRQRAEQSVGIAAFLEVVVAHNSDLREDADMRRFRCERKRGVAATGPLGSDTDAGAAISTILIRRTPTLAVLERAERIEWQFQKAGFVVSKTWIRPIPFAAWCDERNISPDRVARLIFVNEDVRDLLV